MTELKNVEQEVGRFRMRLAAAAAFVLFAFGLLTARLVYLQVYKHEELSVQAENNRITVVPIVPNRGLILDRNGIVLTPNAKTDGVRHVMVIEPVGVQMPQRPDVAASAPEAKPGTAKKGSRAASRPGAAP